jgi:hypothetical protein
MKSPYETHDSNGNGVVWSNDTVGETYCNEAISSARCGQTYIRYADTFAIDFNLVCHETGHAVGLLHGNQSEGTPWNTPVSNQDPTMGCMVKNEVSSLNYLTTLETSEINAVY